MNRREALLAGSALALTAMLPRAAFAKTGKNAEAAKMDALFDSFVQENIKLSPEIAAAYGLDHGKLAWTKHKLADMSPAGAAKRKANAISQLTRLKKVNRKALTGLDASNYDAVHFDLSLQVREATHFPFIGAGWTPYVLSQLSGAYSTVPDFLSAQHTVKTKEDADAYLDRLHGYAGELRQEIESVKHDVALGVVPPDFILAKTIPQIKASGKAAPEASTMVTALIAKAKAAGLSADYGAKAAKIVKDEIYPALADQVSLLESLKAKATHHAGVDHLPNGKAYYAAKLEEQTTTKKTPAEVHQMGLELVKEISGQIDAMMRPLGMTHGTVGERMHAMFKDPKFLYPDTDAGKKKLLADLNTKVHQIQAKLPNYFDVLPKAKVEIVRIPPATEDGAPGGYYMNGSIDGSRPGRVYINLRDTRELPSWTLPTLIFHEGIPGHHLQLSIAAETNLPLLRKMAQYNGYVEGWAVYAEQLAAEIGMYKNDPYGHIGQLHDALLRAVRLVLDSGIHAMGWSREKAIAYYSAKLGDPKSGATSEVERYCVWPGQASGYMIGKRTMLALRARAQKALGNRFDIKKFHDAVILSGALPLTVLSGKVDDYIRAEKA